MLLGRVIPGDTVEALSLLACQAAHARKHGECLPFTELMTPCEAGRKESGTRTVVVAGLKELVRVLEGVREARLAEEGGAEA